MVTRKTVSLLTALPGLENQVDHYRVITVVVHLLSFGFSIS